MAEEEGSPRVSTSGKVFSSTWFREHWVEVVAGFGGLLVTLYRFRKGSSSTASVPPVTPAAQPAAPASSTTSVTTGGGSTGTLSGGIIDQAVIDNIDAQIAALQAQMTQYQLAAGQDHASLGVVAQQISVLREQIARLQQQRQEHVNPPHFLGPPTPAPPTPPNPTTTPTAAVGGTPVPTSDWLAAWQNAIKFMRQPLRLVSPPVGPSPAATPTERVQPPPSPAPPASTPTTANPAPNPQRPSIGDITHWQRVIPPPPTTQRTPPPNLRRFRGPIGPPARTPQ